MPSAAARCLLGGRTGRLAERGQRALRSGRGLGLCLGLLGLEAGVVVGGMRAVCCDGLDWEFGGCGVGGGGGGGGGGGR